MSENLLILVGRLGDLRGYSTHAGWTEEAAVLDWMAGHGGASPSVTTAIDLARPIWVYDAQEISESSSVTS